MGRKRRICILVLCAATCLLGCSDNVKITNTDMQELRESLLSAVEKVQPHQYEGLILSITPRLGERITEKKLENPDAIGWLVVPGTRIDDVILQNPKNNNNYYTTHDFYKRPSKTAAYGADWRIDFTSGFREDLTNNIALYGHSFDEDPNGELFSQMKKYKDPEFARTHPYVFFSTAEEDMVWEVFAVLDATIDLPYIVPDLEWDSLSAVLDVVYAASIYDYGVTVTEEDKLLTIGCCSFSVPGKELLPFDVTNPYRFVVMARLVSPEEQIKEQASFTINEDPLPPDEIPAIYHAGNDIFMYDGFVWFNVSGSDSYRDIDLSNVIPIGEIEQTGVTMDLQDWDAVSLEAGTQILRYPANDKILIAIVDGTAIPYLKFE